MLKKVISVFFPFLDGSNSKIKRAISLIIIIYVTLVFFPQIVFKHSIKYGPFVVRSTKPIDSNIEIILDKSHNLISKSQVWDERATFKVFINDNFWSYSFFSLSSFKAFGVNLPFVHNIFISKNNISNDLVYRNGKTNNRASLHKVIAHECTHSLL